MSLIPTDTPPPPEAPQFLPKTDSSCTSSPKTSPTPPIKRASSVPSSPRTPARRLDQNRKAQRAFRARHQQYIHELEQRSTNLDQVTRICSQMKRRIVYLESVVRHLVMENAGLAQKIIQGDKGDQKELKGMSPQTQIALNSIDFASAFFSSQMRQSSLDPYMSPSLENIHEEEDKETDSLSLGLLPSTLPFAFPCIDEDETNDGTLFSFKSLPTSSYEEQLE